MRAECSKDEPCRQPNRQAFKGEGPASLFTTQGCELLESKGMSFQATSFALVRPGGFVGNPTDPGPLIGSIGRCPSPIANGGFDSWMTSTTS